MIHDLTAAMGLDAALSSHPIIMKVSHPDKITEIFDSISYAKVQYFSSYNTLELSVQHFHVFLIN